MDISEPQVQASIVHWLKYIVCLQDEIGLDVSSIGCDPIPVVRNIISGIEGYDALKKVEKCLEPFTNDTRIITDTEDKEFWRARLALWICDIPDRYDCRKYTKSKFPLGMRLRVDNEVFINMIESAVTALGYDLERAKTIGTRFWDSWELIQQVEGA